MGGGDATVKQVRPANHAAVSGPDTIAEIDLKNFKYHWQGKARTYSGPAKAGFDHYNDGRFVLTQLCFNDRKASPGGETVVFHYDIRVR